MQVSEAGMGRIVDAVAEMNLTQEGRRHLQRVKDAETSQAFMGAVPVQEEIRMRLMQWPEPLHHLVHRSDERFFMGVAVQRFDAAVHAESRRIIGDSGKGVCLGRHSLVVLFVAGVRPAGDTEGGISALGREVRVHFQEIQDFFPPSVVQIAEGHLLLIQKRCHKSDCREVILLQNTPNRLAMLFGREGWELYIPVEVPSDDFLQDPDQTFLVMQIRHEHFQDMRGGIKLLRHFFSSSRDVVMDRAEIQIVQKGSCAEHSSPFWVIIRSSGSR